MRASWVALFFAVFLPAQQSLAASFPEGTSKKTTVRTGTFSVSFPVFNDKKKPLILGAAKTTHRRCLAEIDKKPILPGKTATVTFLCVGLDKGFFTKSATISSNQGTFTLTVSGTSDPSPLDATCKDLRLDGAGGSLENVSVRNQKSADICYAEAVAQVYDAWRFTHGDSGVGDQSSAVEIALAFAMKDYGGRTFGCIVKGEKSSNTDLLALLAERGSCSEAYIAENYPKSSDRDYVGAVEGIFKRSLANQLISCVKQDIETCMAQYGVTPEQAIADSSLAPLLRTKSLAKFLMSVSDVSCPGSLKLKTKSRFTAQTLSDFSQINKFLDSPRSMPIVAEICADVLTEGKSFSITCGREDFGKHPNHSVLIAGRRVNPRTKKCELLVRNSWGTSCLPYSGEWDCEPGKGSVWVDAEELERATKLFTVVR